MSPAKGRTQTCGKTEAHTRLTHARAFIDTATLVLDVADDAAPNVAASLAVLAGIAACDAACCFALGRRPRGQDHREAITILSGIEAGGKAMGGDLARLLDMKDNAQYGMAFVTTRAAGQAVKWAQRLVAAAESIIQS